MYLLISPTGAKLWRFKYHVNGKEKLLAIGPYPEVSLAEAREARGKARKRVREGGDPSAEKQQAKRQGRIAAANTFEALARAWHANTIGKWTAFHAHTVLRRLSAHLFPAMGAKPIASIGAPELLDALR